MAQGYTVFFTYRLANESSGYTSAVHCNYINKLYLDNISNKEVNIYFNDINDFKFLSISGGTGYSANKVYMMIQLINNAPYALLDDVKPISQNWKEFDVSNQIFGYSGNYISPLDMVSTVFKVSLTTYNISGSTYVLDYLGLETNLSFGDEELFLGNVETDIEATVYTTDLSLNLPLNEFNSTTNPTWDNVSPVNISEIGLYDADKNLVAIGKFNNPVQKDSTISRTIVFELDF